MEIGVGASLGAACVLGVVVKLSEKWRQQLRGGAKKTEMHLGRGEKVEHVR